MKQGFLNKVRTALFFLICIFHTSLFAFAANDNPLTGDTQGRYLGVVIGALAVSLVIIIVIVIISAKKKK